MGPVPVQMAWNHAPITANIANLPFLISFVLNSFSFSGEPVPHPSGSNQSPPGQPTSVPVSLLFGKIGSVFTQPGLMMSAHRLPSAQPMKMSSIMKSVVLSVKYSCSPAVYHEGVFRMPIFVKNSGMNIPAAPSIAHLQCTSSACWFHLRLSGSDPVKYQTQKSLLVNQSNMGVYFVYVYTFLKRKIFLFLYI